jgi:hypothetical protein
MVNALPMADGSHKAFGTAHVPCVRVGEDFGDSCDGFTAPCGGHDRSDLCGLSGANDLVDPEHVVPYEVSGFLNRSFVRKRKWFL